MVPASREKQAAEVVDAVDVVGMLMRKEDAVDTADDGRSGPVSTSTLVLSHFRAAQPTSMEQRRPPFFGSAGPQWPHPLPGRGKPLENPQPRIITAAPSSCQI
jgi:hypothetical protein